MKQLRLQFKRLNIVQVSLFLLLTGVFLGVLFANLFKDNFTARLQEYEGGVFSRIVSGDINYSGLFRYILGKNFNSFLIFWLLSITILGLPYMALKITSFGFFTGFFISAATMQYGWKGLFLVLVFVFPHGLLYLPIGLVSLYKGFEIYRSIYQDNRTNLGGIAGLLRQNLLILLLLAFALLVASFLEAYPGAYFLKKALGLLV